MLTIGNNIIKPLSPPLTALLCCKDPHELICLVNRPRVSAFQEKKILEQNTKKHLCSYKYIPLSIEALT